MTINALRILNLRPRNRTGGDCVVLALTFITGAAYTEVEDLIRDHHSRYMSAQGTRAYGVHTERVLKDQFELFGWRLTRVELPPLRHRLWSFREAFPTGTYFVRIQRHAFVVQDNQQFDACDSSQNSIVEGAWKAEKIVAELAKSA